MLQFGSNDPNDNHWMPMTDVETISDSHWLSVPRAALQLGVSESTLRRRIRDGHFPTRQEPYKGLEVQVPSLTVPDGLHQSQDPPINVKESLGASLPVSDGQTSSLPVTDTHEVKPTPDLAAHAITEMRMVAEQMRSLFEQERTRSTDLDEKLRQAEQVTAMHQERSRNLEEETKRLRAQLALPPTQPEPVPSTDPVEELRAKVDELTQRLQAQPGAVVSRPWWQRWRRG